MWASLCLLGYAGDALVASMLGTVSSPISSPSAIAILATIASGMMALTAIIFSLLFLGLQVGNSS